MVLDDILYNIFLFTISNIILILLIGWISWNYYVEYKKKEIQNFIDTIDTFMKSPELLDKYQEDVEKIVDSFDNILNPFADRDLNELKNDFRSQANFAAELNVIKDSAKAAAAEEAARMGRIVEAAVADWYNRNIRPMVNGWNRMTRDWHNFWGGRWGQMGQHD
jgi:hypothetical protein